ncbi:MAG: OmpH family outer membrane protein [Ignavibacteria bacterium]|nr:OmpH family outer membrane protein [Ignavibacteria bacterium]MBT8380783.1 OmpH family outer membrane protein [Ignavibacteria bacterium]MBT8392877.1 OmpH family outer membrane protein [Ignavibacteria bacterium]NNL19708.1 OmpH family outer membrane protein [Ignavibacteriaceae bacterium]
MKYFIFLSCILFFISSNSYSQLKVGYIDSDTILENLPDAQDARQKLDALIQEWQNELKKMEADIKAKRDDFEKRKLIMTEQTSQEMQQEIETLEAELSTFREKKFGANGEVFQKQNELMKPIQNKVFNIIQQIALEEDLDFVFDRSGDVMFLYAKEEYDLTVQVLERLKLE